MRSAKTGPTHAGARGLLQALFCAGCLAAAAAPTQARNDASTNTVVWEGEQDQWVRLEPRDQRSAPANEHPVQVSASVLTGVLATLSVTEDEQTQSVFNPDESAQLGDALSRALAQATPEQDVTFRIVGTNPLAGKVKSVRVNSGRVFQQGGKLNVIFGDVHAKMKKKTLYGQVEEDFSKPRPASRSSSKKHDWILVLPQGAELQPSRDDWVAFESSQLATVAAQTPAVPAAAPSTGAPVLSTPSAGAIAPPPATPSALSPEADMERRLRTLKDLHDQGLITDEAYRAKIEEILSAL